MKKTLAKILALALCAILLVTGTVFVTLAYLQANTEIVRNTFSSAGVTLVLNETKVNSEGKPVSADGQTVLNNEADYIREGILENAYELVPGSTYMKDPMVTVKENSVPCYIFIAICDTMFESGNGSATVASDKEQMLLNGDTNEGRKGYISAQLAANGWVKMEGAVIESEAITGMFDGAWDNGYTIYCYTETESRNDGTNDGWIDASNGDIKLKIFEEFTVKSTVTATDLNANDKTLQIIAFGVQSQGFKADGSRDVYRVAWEATYGSQEDMSGT